VSSSASSERVWRPHAGPQERFLRCPAFEAGYGGAAGAGKSDALLVGALRHVGHPRYHGMLFRREAKQLWGSLQPRAQELYPGAGGRWREKDSCWHFPSGARVEMASCEHEQDVRKYQGRSIQYLGWDELTHFLEFQFVYMLSRLRGPKEIPIRVRWASNPGGVGHDWVMKRYAGFLFPGPGQKWHDPEAEYRGPYFDSGHIAWYLRDDTSKGEELVEPWTPLAKTRTFFHARVHDNPVYAGGEYEANLYQLQLLDREQLLFGNWMARPGAGMFFKRAWFGDFFLSAIPALVTSRVRYWDLASTPKERATPRSAWTAGVRIAKLLDGRFLIEDIVRGQWGPGEVERTIKATAKSDPPNTRLVIEHDPGQAGDHQAYSYTRTFSDFDVHAIRPQGDKLTRAKLPSAQAEAGNIWLVRAPWNEAFLREGESFPEGAKDQIDSLSGGYIQAKLFGNTRARSGGSREMTTDNMGGL
jgi:predicted phage terminase large subunit-like protein